MIAKTATIFFFIIIYSFNARAEKVWTLKEVLVCTLAHNAELILSDAKIKAFEYQLRAQDAYWLPQANITMHGDYLQNQESLIKMHAKQAGITPSISWRLPTGAHIQGHATQFVKKGNQNMSQTQWQLSFEQPLLKGASLAINQQPLKDIEYAQEQSTILQSTLKSSVLHTAIHEYANLATAWQQLKIQQRYLHQHSLLSEVVARKIEMGKLSDLDGLLLEVQTAKYQQMLNQSKYQIEQLSAKLLRTMGRDEPQNLSLDALPAIEFRENQSLLTKALEAQTRLNQIELTRQKNHEAVIRDNHHWDLKLKAHVASSHMQYNTIDGFDYSLYDHHHHQQRYIGLYLTVPFKPGADFKHQLYQNRLSQQITQTDYNQKVMDIKVSLQQAQHQIKFSQDNLSIAKKSAQLSQQAKDLIQQKYLAGYASQLDLQQAQLQALQSECDLEASQKRLYLAQIELIYQGGVLNQQWQNYV